MPSLGRRAPPPSPLAGASWWACARSSLLLRRPAKRTGTRRPAQATLAADVVLTELVGLDAFLRFDLPKPEVHPAALAAPDDARDTGRTASRLTARVAAETLQRMSGRVDLSVDLPRLHLFDPRTTERIHV